MTKHQQAINGKATVGLCRHDRRGGGEHTNGRRCLIVVVYIILLVLTFLACAPRSNVEKRLAIFPVIDRSYNDSNAWLGWSLSRNTIDRLQTIFSADTLVYPLDWVWEAVDLDSVADIDYLLAYARRLGADWALVAAFESECPGCPLRWTAYDLQDDRVLLQQEMPWDPNAIRRSAQTLASALLNLLHLSPAFVLDADFDPESDKPFAHADRLLAQGAPQEALPWAEKAFAADSGSVNIRNLLARTHFSIGTELKRDGKNPDLHYLVALRLCERSLTFIDSNNAESHRLIGRYYLTEENWARAQHHLARAREIDPQNARIYLDIAHLHQSRIKSFGFGNEEQVLEYAIDLNPAFEQARLFLADHLYFRNYKKHAERALQMLLAVHPRSIEGLLMVGKFAVAANEVDQVIRTYNQILQIDPHNSIAFYNLGVYYFNLGNLEHAEQFFHRAVRYGDYADAHLYLGTIFEIRGDIDRAISEYRLRIRAKRGFDDVYADRAMERLFQLTQPDSGQLRLNVRAN
ncbi:tetratricopeptide repeat protein [candidate division KSB1 bacterium]|nr:tetratricopeptide repeat protein [candidate division KSB1 bacterium]